MTAWLSQQGEEVNCNRVQRLMRAMGLEAIYPKPRLSAGRKHKLYAHLLRDVPVSRVDQVWSSDEVFRLARTNYLSGPFLFDLARVLSFCAQCAAHDGMLPLPLREQEPNNRASLAVALLRRADKTGFFRAPAAIRSLNVDSNLDFLRNRPDFKAFVASLPRPQK